MASKKDDTTADTGRLLQTRVASDVAEWVQSQAAAEGFTVALWLRRLILQRKEKADRAAPK
jgi:hypothetical protein